MTPFGKIAVVKSILVPTLTHLFLSLPSPTKEYIKRISDNLYNFVWDGACNRIKKTVLIKNYEEGGLKMLDLYNYNLTMKIKWLKNLVSEGNKDCYEFTNNIFDINKLFNSGIKYCETLCKAIKNDFWRDVLGSFKIYVSKCNFTTWSEVINMPLFYNENLRIGSKHFFNSTLYNHGIRYIRDVLNEDGSFKNWNDIKNATSNGINFLEFYSIISSVLKVIFF